LNKDYNVIKTLFDCLIDKDVAGLINRESSGIFQMFVADVADLKLIRYLFERFSKFEVGFDLVGKELIRDLILAIWKNHNIEMLKIAVESVPDLMMLDLAFAAVTSKGWDAVKIFIDLIKGKEKWDEVIHANGEEAFQQAVKSRNMEFMMFLIESTGDREKRRRMIHANCDCGFRYAASQGDIEMLKVMVGYITDEEEREEMIHSNNDYAFRLASANGRVDVFKYLVEISLNRDEMIHANNDYAFQQASIGGHIEIMSLIIEMTPDVVQKEKMISSNYNFVFQQASKMGGVSLAVLKYLLQLNRTLQNPHNNEYAFLQAASYGHIEILKLILSEFHDQKDKEQLIHSNEEEAFQQAAANGHLEILKFLIDLTPNQEQRDQMIHANNDFAFTQSATNGHADVLQYIIEQTPNRQKRLDMIQYKNNQLYRQKVSSIYYRPSTRIIGLFLIYMDDSYYQTATRNFKQFEPFSIQLSPINLERNRVKLIDICYDLSFDSSFLKSLPEKPLQKFKQQIDYLKLLKTYRMIVKNALTGFQLSLHPLIPDEIFSIIISYSTNHTIPELSPKLKNSSFKNIYDYYKNKYPNTPQNDSK
jgi:ankyrin repeat protein